MPFQEVGIMIGNAHLMLAPIFPRANKEVLGSQEETETDEHHTF